MHTRLLIDALVRQTTVLLAQLSTAAGSRSPLAHVADEVFVSLSRELEAQGVGRKVAADMFGLALRGYQKRIQRLAESVTEPERTLWSSVLDFIAERQSVTREQVLARFHRDTDRDVVGVLTDLVNNGLVHASGRGVSAVYGLTTDAERRLYAKSAEEESLDALAWAVIRSRRTLTTNGLADELRLDLDVAREIVRRLSDSSRLVSGVTSDDAVLEAAPLFIPIGTEMGWEAAVLDHFRAVANAIAAKVRSGSTRAGREDAVGGTTLSFKLGPGHPDRERVLGLLSRIRREVIGFWEEVEAHGAEHPAKDEDSTRVWFYFGQYVEDGNTEDAS
jgi:hypothetical protein